jgi:hypothetical protein
MYTPADAENAVKTEADAERWREAGAKFVGGTLKGQAISLSCDRRDCTECQGCILNLVGQNLRRTDEKIHKFNQEQQILTQIKQVFERLGAIVVTSEGEVQFVTQGGKQLLSQYFSPYAPHSLPESVQHWFKLTDTKQLADFPPGE